MIATKEIKFRKAGKADAELIAGWWQDGRVMAPVGFPKGLAITAVEVSELLGNTTSTFLLIVDEEENEIGEFVFHMLEENVATFDIKIGVVNNQGQGYGEAALRKGLALIKASTPAKKIQISVNHTNSIAQHLYKKVGFQQTDFKENTWVDQLGQHCSEVIMEYQL